ncbi:hypothetical protein GCM10027610_012540 [Dactylosporangium cerinum]
MTGGPPPGAIRTSTAKRAPPVCAQVERRISAALGPDRLHALIDDLETLRRDFSHDPEDLVHP